jgi:ABC-type transporter Mla MlaB component
VQPVPPSRPIVIIVRGPIAPGATRELCERLCVAAASCTPEPVACDVSALTETDELALDALARLQLTAHRLGTSIRLHNAREQLVDLLALVGLSNLLPVVAEPGGSGIDPDGLAEQREQVRVDEEVDPGDAAT